MRKRILLLMCCVLSTAVWADFEWNAESGTWDVASNWTGGVKPDGTANVNLRKSAASICTLNTDEGLFSVRLMVQSGQTWNIENGGRVGFAWSRTGYGGAATINMTGSGTFVLNNDDLYIGEYNGSAVWTMSDTSSMVLADSSRTDDNLYIGKDGSGTLRIIGSHVTITPSRIDFGWARTSGTSPVSTLEYILDSEGASAIVVQRINKIGDPTSTNHLIVSAPGITLDPNDIVLIQATGTYTTGGKGAFDTLNGGSAVEGTQIVLGGNVYALSYQYDADGDGRNNDIALVYVRTAKHMARTPVPADKAALSSSPTILSWTLPDPNDGVSDITCMVSFGIEPPDPNRTNMDSVTLVPNVFMVEINADNFPTWGAQPLVDANEYYWVVDCVDASPDVDPADGKGLTWLFTTDYNMAPVVDAGPDQVVWLGKSGTAGQEVVNLSGSVTDDGKPNPPAAYTIQWTQVSGPATVTISPDNTLNTSLTLMTVGVYVFQLNADDTEKQADDTVQIVVGSDSCHASYLNGTNYNSKDFNTDCVVDLADFVDFASDWLTCTNTQEGCV